MNRPLGITILAVIYALKGLVFLAVAALGAVILGIVPGALMFGMAIGTLFGIFALIQLAIAGALFSGKSWARYLIVILSIISLIIGLASVATGLGATLVLGIIFDLIVIYYMFTRRVKVYFGS